MQSLATLLVRRSFAPALLVTSSLVALQLGACTGDEFTAGSGGGGGGDATTTTPTSSPSSSSGAVTTTTDVSASVASSSSGGGCSGCFDQSGACREEPDAQFCGSAGQPCTTCPASEVECEVAACDDAGACGFAVATDDTPCEGGVCRNGACDRTVENCTNGVDDTDDDGAVDCLDTECMRGGYLCSPAKEIDWVGPLLVIASSVDTECPLGFDDGGNHFAEPKGTCDCEVDAPCALAVETGAVGCPETERTVVTEECGPLVLGNAAAIASIEPTCQASAEVENPGRKVLSACVLLEGGCNEDAACKPPLSALPPLSSTDDYLLCIRRQGNHACPEEFPAKRLGFTADDLVCPCPCEVDPETCDGTLQTYFDQECLDCNLAEGPCAELQSPSSNCTPYAGGLANFARFEQDPKLEPVAVATDAPPRFAGDAAVTYCCQNTF